MSTFYTAKEYKGYGKHDVYWNEFRTEGDEYIKVKCHSGKFFNGDENERYYDEKVVNTWKKGADNVPDWFGKYI